MINVTKTYLPPLKKYQKYLKKIWASGWLTSNGPLLRELERKLQKYLGVKYLFLVNNSTLALQIAIEALDLKDEIITTPFSYIATSSSIKWQGATPVYADIDKDTLCMDPKKIEKAITKKTEAILATHIFGNPCNIGAITKIAKKHKLKVVYDAAHTFGVKYKGKSILNYGDISTISFHATKIFHTIEGGALITNSPSLAKKISYMRNFGHNGYEKFFGLGINGKMSEFHAAMGLCNLSEIKKIISSRKNIWKAYDKLLLSNVYLTSGQEIKDFKNHNYAYYPIIFQSEKQLLATRKLLNKSSIYPRRYFFPSLNTLAFLNKKDTPIAEGVSKRILCLPLYHDLKIKDVKKICSIILKSLLE